MRETLFRACVLTASPGCSILVAPGPPPDATTPAPGFNLIRGSLPRDGVVFGDVIQARRCGSFGPSVPGDRFQVCVRDKNDGTASVRYTKLVGPAMPGAICNETIVYSSTGVVTCPLRVDSSLFHQGATVTDVRLVRIK